MSRVQSGDEVEAISDTKWRTKVLGSYRTWTRRSQGAKSERKDCVRGSALRVKDRLQVKARRQ